MAADFELNYTALTQRHPERSRWEPKWSDYRLLYRGGDDFLRSAGQLVNTRQSSVFLGQVANALTPQAFGGQRNRRFLYQLEAEPDPVYFSIWNRAYYINYMAAILDYFRHNLFAEEPQIRPCDGDTPPDWWPEFSENASGSDKSFVDFVRDVWLDVMICRRAGWLIGLNTDVTGAKGKAVTLTPYPAEQIYDWERDDSGELLWVVLGTKQTYREFPKDRVQTETFTYLDRESWKTWEIIRQKDGDQELNIIGEGTYDLERVPFEMIELPEGLWIADKLAAPCTDMFNKQVRLTNAQLLGCIMQPFLKSGDQNAQSRVFGEGELLRLRSADPTGGGEEDFGWKSPDTAPLQFIAEQIKEQKDELYRICHMMSLAVDSKAVSAIARSGASKIEDRKAELNMLVAFGGYVSAAMMRTANLISEIQGDGTDWEIDGFKNFTVSSLDEEIQIAALAKTMQFKSRTANEKLELKVINRLLDFVDERTKETIEQETKDGYDQEEEAKLAPQIDPVTSQPLAARSPDAGSDFQGIKPIKKLGLKATQPKQTPNASAQGQ